MRPPIIEHQFVPPKKQGEEGYQVLGETRILRLPPDRELRARLNGKPWERHTDYTRRLVGLRGALENGGKSNVIIGRAALGIAGPREHTIPRERIERAIRTCWPEEQVARYLAGEPLELPSLTDFSKGYRAEHRSVHRSKIYKSNRKGVNAFKGMMENIYPGLYDALRDVVDPDTLDPAMLGKELCDRYNRGESISSTALRDSPEPKDKLLRRKILALRRQRPGLYGGASRESRRKIRKDATYTAIAAKISGLEKKDVEITKSAFRTASSIAETLVHFVATWGPITQVSLEGLIEAGDVYRTGEEVIYGPKSEEFQENNNEGQHADLRINNRAIEVKLSTGYVCPKQAQEIIRRYSPRGKVWKTEDPLKSSSVVFFMRPDQYEKRQQLVEKAGITVISGEQITEAVAKITACMKEKYSPLVEKTAPQIHDIEYLTRLSQELTTTPCILMRSGNKRRREWTISVLESLIATGAALAKNNYEPAEPQDSLHKPHGAKIHRTNRGSFVVHESTIAEAGKDHLGPYIQEHRQHLDLDRLQERFPQLRGINKRDIAVWDSEITGLSTHDPLICLTIASLGQGMPIKTFLARDYGEEDPTLRRFFDEMREYGATVTFGGKGFDVPRIIARAKYLGISTEGLNVLSNGTHLDLLKPAQDAFGHRFPDSKLQTIEKLAFGIERKNDLGGVEIPTAYQSYVDGETSAQDMYRIMHHCGHDVVTPIALLAYFTEHGLKK